MKPTLYNFPYSANVFARWNAHSTKKKEKICGIYAKDSTNWRVMMTKVGTQDLLQSGVIDVRTVPR